MPQEATNRRVFLGTALAASAAGAAPAAVAATPAQTVAQSQGRSTEPQIVPGSPSRTYSRAVVFNGVAYVAGVVGSRPGSSDPMDASFEVQCRQSMENLRSSVEASGSRLDRVMKCQCFLTDAGDFATFNRVYLEFFASNPPARSTVVVKELVVPGAKLEIDCFAAVG